MTMGSALYTGAVVHERLRPRAHRLRYRVFSLLLDLDELPALHRRLKLFSVDRPNLLSLRLADHGDGGPGTLRERVDAWMRLAGLPPVARVRLLTMPRLFGYAFNPLSVFFCDAADGRLQAIVYEVTSTFGERHHYVLPVDAAQADAAQAGRPIAQRCGKRMHVSPFIGMEMDYAFRIVVPGDAGRLSIGVDVHDADGLLLHASHAARARPLTDGTLAQAVLAHPLLTLKVIAAIHWEALRLWLRGVPLQPRPPRAARPITTLPPSPRP
jgi:DUF1365 family protein